MRVALRVRGEDGTLVWTDGSVGLVHAHFWTAAEDVGERQPLGDRAGRHWISADARLDNRDELLDQLGVIGERPSDSSLILAAYARWGSACLTRLQGDFAFAIWDNRTRQLVAARDVVGLRPLHYFPSKNGVVLGSTIGAIIAGLPQPCAINFPYVHDFLNGKYERLTSETPYQGLFRVPPGHMLIAEPTGRCSVREYDHLGSQAGDSCRSESEWIERFRELFQRSVSVRLRSQRPVGILLSGGLDSSAVACVAHRMAAGDSPRLYSAVFERTPGADERAYAQSVIEACRPLPSTLVPSDDSWGVREIGQDGGYPLDEPEHGVNRVFEVRLLQAAQRDSCRVVMGGYLADQVLHSDAYATPWLLTAMPLRSWRRELDAFARSTRQSAAAVVARAVAGRARHEFSRRVRRGRWRHSARLRSPLARLILHRLTNGLALHRHHTRDRIGVHTGTEWRLPFADRRLLEFVLSLPTSLLCQGGTNKRVLRDAVSRTVPAMIMGRRDRAYLTALALRGADRERAKIENFVNDSEAVRSGFLDSREAGRRWGAYQADASFVHFRALGRFLAVEAWARHVRGSALDGRVRRVASLLT
jgi:asparagine synthase (glutamine-hydrolysing)